MYFYYYLILLLFVYIECLFNDLIWVINNLRKLNGYSLV